MPTQADTHQILKGNTVVIPRVERASSMAARMRGLLGRSGLDRGEAMHIVPCSSIHTWFMRFDLDLVFLSRENRVVRVVRNVRPWRAVLGGARAHSVVELQAGWLAADALATGDEVTWR